jgi:hypothetical protein
MAIATLIGLASFSDEAPIETTAAADPALAGPEDTPEERPANAAELSGTEWRIAHSWGGDAESLGALVAFGQADATGPSPRVVVRLFCNSTVNELEWDGWTFTTRPVLPEDPALLCRDTDADIDQFWRSGSTFVTRFSGSYLVIERDEEELWLEQTAFGRPTREGADGRPVELLDPELVFGDWRVVDLGPGGGLIDQAGRADDITINLTRDEVVVLHACSSFTFDAEWEDGSLWTRQRAEEPTLPVGCRSHPGLVSLVEFLDRSGWIAALLVDGQLELARSPGTERIRAMSTNPR